MPKDIVKYIEKAWYPPGHPSYPKIPVKSEEAPIILRNEDDPIDVDADSDEDKCAIDHQLEGFDDQIVYVWHGDSKGKLGRVLQMSGGIVKVGLESAVRGNGILFLPADDILA